MLVGRRVRGNKLCLDRSRFQIFFFDGFAIFLVVLLLFLPFEFNKKMSSLVIKFDLGNNNVRRVCRPPGDRLLITFNWLKNLMIEMSILPSANTRFTLQWQDSEGDMITIGSENELKDAVAAMANIRFIVREGTGLLTSPLLPASSAPSSSYTAVPTRIITTPMTSFSSTQVSSSGSALVSGIDGAIAAIAAAAAAASPAQESSAIIPTEGEPSAKKKKKASTTETDGQVQVKGVWTKEKIRIVFGICQENPKRKDRMRLLKLQFPDRTEGSLKYQIMRYQCRNDNKMAWDPANGVFEGYASDGKLHSEVWEERDWRMPSNTTEE
jgi:hypothetical protein